MCYGNLGNTYRNLGDFRNAIEYYEKSLEIAEETDSIDLKRIVNLNFGLVYYESEPELAYDYCKHSIELSEIISGKLVEEEHKIGFYAHVSDAYQCMVPLCMKLEKKKEAFEYIERSKSRAFLDVLAATEIKPVCKSTSALQSLLDNEGTYLARIQEIQMRHLRQTKIPVELGEIEQIHKDLTQIYDKIEEFDPEYVFTRRGKSLSLDEIKVEFSLQKRDMTLVEYFVTKDRTFISVISSRDNELHIESVPLSEEILNRYTETYQKKVLYYLDFQDMSKYLIEPISEYLNEGSLIYFVPYGALHYLPLHAMEINGEPLIKRYPVAYIPSASLIRFCQSKGSGTLQSCASFGVEFEEEAENVAQLFDIKAFLGFSATKENVIKNCSKDIIHFACHGQFDASNPLSSGVKLFDGILTAREIFGMRLNTELVTLAACQTGINQRSPGDELIGLTRALLYAGAPSVIVSLWSVYSPSTHEIMLEFYMQLKNGADKATALQKAQITIMEKERYSHPYFWAPFVLIGNWQ